MLSKDYLENPKYIDALKTYINTILSYLKAKNLNNNDKDINDIVQLIKELTMVQKFFILKNYFILINLKFKYQINMSPTETRNMEYKNMTVKELDSVLPKVSYFNVIKFTLLNFYNKK